MATILLSAAGAAIGSGFGGTVLGLSGAVIGRAVGATLGRAIDQKILGGGSEAVEVGKIERFRLTGASEGTPVTRAWGRVRLAGQVIWATRFKETVTESGGGGKGGGTPKTTEFSYSVSLAIALCEGEIRRVETALRGIARKIHVSRKTDPRALIEGGALSLAGLITHTCPAADAPKAYETAFTDASCLKMILDWKGHA